MCTLKRLSRRHRALGKQRAKPSKTKPDTVDRPVGTARTFVHHYNSTRYCNTETVFFSILLFLQTNITSQMRPSGGRGADTEIHINPKIRNWILGSCIAVGVGPGKGKEGKKVEGRGTDEVGGIGPDRQGSCISKKNLSTGPGYWYSNNILGAHPSVIFPHTVSKRLKISSYFLQHTVAPMSMTTL